MPVCNQKLCQIITVIEILLTTQNGVIVNISERYSPPTGHCPVRMFYEMDFARFGEQHISKLQIFSRKLHNRPERRKKFQKFSNNFSLHRFSYVFYRNLHSFERYIWSLILVAAAISTIFVSWMLSEKYTDRKFVTVVENSQYPVFNVEFPAVALCAKHRVNWGRLEKARKKFLPPDADNATLEMFASFIKRIDTLEFRTFDNLAGLEDEPVHLIDTISISQLAFYLAFRCNEFELRSCTWSEKPFDCCGMFLQENSALGVCLVFNSIVTEESRQKAASDRFYPYRTSKNGEGSGLTFSVKRNLSLFVPGATNIGIELMIKKYDQWTDPTTYRLRPNTYNAVIVRPQTTKAQRDIKSIPVAYRNCLFRNEKPKHYFIPGLKYRQWNCKSQCHQEYLIDICNCTIPLFFRSTGVQARECTASDFICIYNNRDVFADDKQPNQDKFVKKLGRGMSCPCPNSCDSLSYPLILNTVPLYNKTASETFTQVDIYYQSEVMMKYITTMQFTTMDLLGYFGGIVTLFIGASVITGTEILYFVLKELLSCLHQKACGRKMSRKIKQSFCLKLSSFKRT